MTEKLWDVPALWRIVVDLPDNPLRSLNVYVLQSAGHTLVIDTGFGRSECRETLFPALEALISDWSKTSLFLTHLHSDHIGLVWDFVARGVPVFMGRIDYDYFNALTLSGVQRITDGYYRQEGCPEELVGVQDSKNQGRVFAPRPAFPATLLGDGDTLTVGALTLTALWTPGHTPGHMALYLPRERLLFSGDHVLFDITPNICIWKDVPDPLGDYLESLRRIRALDVQRTFPAHRSPTGELSARVDALTAHHARRLEEIVGIVRAQSGATAYEVASQVRWNAKNLPWEDFPRQQKWFASGEAIAHLHHLVKRQTLLRQEICGVARYFPAPPA